MIDKFSLTINITPDIQYLESHGEIREEKGRMKLYKHFCGLEKAAVFFFPHKYSDSINANIPFTKIDLNPKYFECYTEMLAYVCSMFKNPSLTSEDFNVSRIDIAGDSEGFPIDCILSALRVSKIRSDNFNVIKGTIYAGSDPKIRIYDKVKEIKNRQKKNIGITDYEKSLVESGKNYTRVEITVRNGKRTLKDVADNPESFVQYFDRLEVFEFVNGDGSGMLQTVWKYINRKFRVELERYKNYELVKTIKEQYLNDVREWFSSEKEPF